MNAQKRKTSGVHVSSRKPTKKVCDENERNKNVIHGRKPVIMPIRRTGENDLDEPQGNDYGYNEGTICFVRGSGGKGVFFERGRHINGRHFTRTGWHSGVVDN